MYTLCCRARVYLLQYVEREGSLSTSIRINSITSLPHQENLGKISSFHQRSSLYLVMMVMKAFARSAPSTASYWIHQG